MSDKFFLDTNIFVYSFDSRHPNKQKQAKDLIELALRDHRGIVSAQVIQEFMNAATGKFATPLSQADCRSYLDAVLAPLCEIFPSLALYHESLSIQEETGYSFYDALMITAALAGQCRLLYSEDLQNNRKVRELTILNPFV